ncbi:hypothetical protein SAMN05421847_0030 [Halpernia humi]|uniref:BACON domain-containing protein n=1 Tax=Halpernia humi TaxID=493375 RepID=A0A1H5S4V1_9FLAO|nr:hypothetical protein [Halpernia humi]SEF44918.1 hypothetical protein SAMN05421847_0030 [Halpernia humi]
MKKIIFYLSFLFLGCFVISCDRTEPAIGKWEDNIKLSDKTATLSSGSNSIIISTQSTNWWLDSISLNGKIIDLQNIDRFSKNFLFSHSDFTVERKEDGKKIIISMNQNTANVERILVVRVEQGDYFDSVKVTQAKQ